MEESILKLAAVACSVLKLQLANAVSPTWRVEQPPLMSRDSAYITHWFNMHRFLLYVESSHAHYIKVDQYTKPSAAPS